MKNGVYSLIILALLTPSLATAEDSCNDLKSTLQALELTRSIRKSAEAMVNSVDDALHHMSKAERDDVMDCLENDVKVAYFAAYTDYRDASVSAHNVAQRVATTSGIINDRSIQTAIVMSDASIRMISAIIPEESQERNRKRKRKHGEALDSLDAVVDDFFGVIVAAVCQ